MLAALVSAFVLGALFSALVVVSIWLYTAPLVSRKRKDHMTPYTFPSLPEALRESVSGGEDDAVAVESCKWLNLITAFLFQELRDTPEVKSFIMTKIHNEFNELMFTRKEGRMLEQLTVRDYDFGSSLPLFNHAVVQQKRYSSSEAGQLQEVCVGVHVDYCGGVSIGVDADLVFNRVAYVAIRLVKVKGHGVLRFTTLPCTHWSFSFCEEPEMTLEVESTFEGRSFPQLSSFIEAQLRRWVRQKHTLPASKTRYKPFFVKPKPHTQLNELYVHNKRLTVGRLYVEVAKCSKLLHPPSAATTFCTLSTSSLPWQPLLGVWHSRWPEYEFRVQVNDPSATLGIGYKLVVWEGKEKKRNEYVMVSKVEAGSRAARMGARTGDIIVRVNNVRVHSVSQVRKAINKTKKSSILFAVKRPPKHISGHMLRVSKSTTTSTSHQATDRGTKSDGEREERGAEGNADTISLHESSLVVRGTGQSSEPANTSHTVGTAATPLPRDTKNVDEPGQTEDVGVCKAPQWKKKKFKFNVGPKHHYLNVCVYDRLSSASPSEERRELLIGHVTIPLMDVALECLASNSGKHHQRYVLLAPQLTRATANRAVVQASEGGGVSGRGRREEEEAKQFVGSVLLRFRHTTSSDSPPARAEERVDGEERHNTAERETPLAQQHQFQARELEGVQRCHICHKRIWRLKGRVLVCVRCGAHCHKRCVPLSYKTLPCKRVDQDLQSHEAQGFEIYEERGERDGEMGDGEREERDGEMEEGDEELVEHRSLRQQSSEDGFVEVPAVDEEFVKVEEETIGESDDVSWKTASLQDGEGSGSDQAVSSESESERGSESGEDTEQTLAELLACRALSHLPEEERATAIQSKVVELEGEIERAQQLVTTTEIQLNSSHETAQGETASSPADETAVHSGPPTNDCLP